MKNRKKNSGQLAIMMALTTTLTFSSLMSSNANARSGGRVAPRQGTTEKCLVAVSAGKAHVDCEDKSKTLKASEEELLGLDSSTHLTGESDEQRRRYLFGDQVPQSQSASKSKGKIKINLVKANAKELKIFGTILSDIEKEISEIERKVDLNHSLIEAAAKSSYIKMLEEDQNKLISIQADLKRYNVALKKNKNKRDTREYISRVNQLDNKATVVLVKIIKKIDQLKKGKVEDSPSDLKSITDRINNMKRQLNTIESGIKRIRVTTQNKRSTERRLDSYSKALQKIKDDSLKLSIQIETLIRTIKTGEISKIVDYRKKLDELSDINKNVDKLLKMIDEKLDKREDPRKDNSKMRKLSILRSKIIRIDRIIENIKSRTNKSTDQDRIKGYIEDLNDHQKTLEELKREFRRLGTDSLFELDEQEEENDPRYDRQLREVERLMDSTEDNLKDELKRLKSFLKKDAKDKKEKSDSDDVSELKEELNDALEEAEFNKEIACEQFNRVESLEDTVNSMKSDFTQQMQMFMMMQRLSPALQNPGVTIAPSFNGFNQTAMIQGMMYGQQLMSLNNMITPLSLLGRGGPTNIYNIGGDIYGRDVNNSYPQQSFFLRNQQQPLMNNQQMMQQPFMIPSSMNFMNSINTSSMFPMNSINPVNW